MKKLQRVQGSISHEATRWFLRLRAPDCTSTERKAFDVWLTSHPTHHQEYAALQSLWHRMNVLETKPLPEFESILESKARVMPRWNFFGHLQVTLTVAMLLLVIGGAWWWSMSQVTVTAYQTALGERQSVTLSDGTVIDLNTKTALSVHMSREERRVVLTEGEAFFTVAAEEGRPFIVNANGGDIRDIGTRFSVFTQDDHVVVAVEEGTVQIDLAHDIPTVGADLIRKLAAGERVSYSQVGRWSEIEQIDLHLIATWREGKLIFEGVPLNEAIHEINRYWSGQITLADSSLADTELRGVIEIQNLPNFFQSLPEILPVEVTQDQSGHIVVSKR